MRTGVPIGSPKRPVVVLLVEDDDGDAILTARALEEGTYATDCRRVRDGEEALDFLKRRGSYEGTGTPVPDLILLDLNLPKLDGRAVLTEIRKDEDLCHLIVIVLTTSTQDDDVIRSYCGGANSFVTKPVDPDKFAQCVREVESYWMQTVKLPPTERYRSPS